MTSTSEFHQRSATAIGAGGAISRLVRRAANASAARPRLTIGLWIVLVLACIVGGQMAGTKTLTSAQQLVGQSRQAELRLDHAGLQARAVESVLVRSGSASQTRATADALERRLRVLPQVATVRGPSDQAALSIAGGRTVLVQASMLGNPDNATNHVAPIEHAVDAVAAAHPGVKVQEAGQGSLDRTESNVIDQDLHRAELISIPITLLILIFAFGAVAAALVPLLLAFTSVGAALGGLGLVSQIAPSSSTTSSCVVLIGLAVAIDYSLFYIRREREERRAGKSPRAALDAAAATAGRAVLVSGVTVMVGLAGLLLSGTAVFTSVALGTMLVVALAVVGSLTALPAMLALLGDRIDKGRIGCRRAGVPRRRGWGAFAKVVTRHPAASLITAVCVMAALAVPALHLHTANPTDVSDLPSSTPTVVSEHAIERAFPGSPSTAEVVVTGSRLDTAARRHALVGLGDRARTAVHGRGSVSVAVSHDARTALVTVPMPATSVQGQKTAVDALRTQVAPAASRVESGAHALISGDAAESVDFSAQLTSATPRVLAFVLILALLLLALTFGSIWLSAAVVALNLVSVAAAYGVLTGVFQDGWGSRLLGFHSSGTVTDWLPLFLFVILFGLSMDYTVLVLERVREARTAGMTARRAACEGISATGSTVTSAAVIMVAVFAIFGSLRVLELKQLGIGLAVAVLLDATIVRGVALPAVVSLLGEERWRLGRAVRRRPANEKPIDVEASRA